MCWLLSPHLRLLFLCGLDSYSLNKHLFQHLRTAMHACIQCVQCILCIHQMYVHIESFPAPSPCQNQEHHAIPVISQQHVSMSMCCLSESSDCRDMLCWLVDDEEASGHFSSECLCTSLLPSYVRCSLLLPLLWLPVIFGRVITVVFLLGPPSHHCLLCIFRSFHSLVFFRSTSWRSPVNRTTWCCDRFFLH